ncbi:MAG: ROK family protein [bacterium]|jgi:glucokinase|nr:ROK family protein [bacterium]
MTRVAIGIDLGGTDIKAGLVAEDGTLIQKYKKSTEARLGGAKVVERIGDLIGEILSSDALKNPSYELVGVGMGSPGLIDHDKGSITRPVNIPGWDRWICVRDEFMKRFPEIKDVKVDNDANVGALGEALFGRGRGMKVVLCLTLGTGVGGGVVIDGKVMHGTAGFAGELGHIMVNPCGPVCGCGNEGCLETYASATAIARYAQERVRVEHIPSLMKSMVKCRSEITSKVVCEAALQGDPVALDVVAWAGKALGIGIATLIVCFNPAIVCLGGGASNMGDLLFDHARKEIQKRVFFNSHFETPIVKAALGEEAGTIGSAGQLF